MNRLRPVYTLTVSMLLMAASNVSAQNLSRYGTSLLEKLAEETRLTEKLDTLGEGMHIAFCQFRNKPLTVIVRRGSVEHIGYTAFSEEQRTLAPSPIYNFLERYAFQMDVISDSTFSIGKQMEMDNVTFRKGSLAMLSKLYNDTTVAVSITNYDERAYSVDWTRGDQTVCSVFFPASYELLHGSKMIENENRLLSHIKATTAERTGRDSISADNLQKADSTRGSFYILHRGHNRIAAMSGDLYYNLADDKEGNSTPSLLFTRDYPIESIANLFCSNDIENSYVADVKLRKYNFQNETFSVPLTQLMNFFESEECVPFFGVVSFVPHTGIVDAVLQMRNRAQAYEHLMRIKMDVKTISDRKGRIAITLTSYIPTHNIQNLYADDEL